ncbi:uncharacterized protein LOC124135922 isoform X2 [Haliotis rufescens]|uniref:uncharacterized protein LOC124135922 isoform X2 n=1 Tax=Haliotis rufescens TaxID=6454 RepID=UPI00201F685C|nr:uncharacterized protein LOC124135922 isoform X2 [Haliotis rufescens]
MLACERGSRGPTSLLTPLPLITIIHPPSSERTVRPIYGTPAAHTCTARVARFSQNKLAWASLTFHTNRLLIIQQEVKLIFTWGTLSRKDGCVCSFADVPCFQLGCGIYVGSCKTLPGHYILPRRIYLHQGFGIRTYLHSTSMCSEALYW